MRALYRASRGRSEAYLPSYVSVTRMAPVLCCCYLVECHMMCTKICIKNEYSLISICLKTPFPRISARSGYWFCARP